jgi:hypothetical protein
VIFGPAFDDYLFIGVELVAEETRLPTGEGAVSAIYMGKVTD